MKKMTIDLQDKIKKEIEVNENHINNFPLETETGTKKMKEKFHRKAVQERNAYIEKELVKFKDYQRTTYQELDQYVKSVFPKDKGKEYEAEQNKLLELLRMIPATNDIISLEINLGFAHIFYQLSAESETSLNKINSCVLDFIQKMQDAKVTLTINDFNYSPFVTTYMTTLLENKDKENFDDVMQNIFKEVYWECPEIIMHIKRNLISLVKKHYQKLKEYNKIRVDTWLQKENLTRQNIETIYHQKMLDLEDRRSKDEFINLQKFLGKSKNVDDYTSGAPLRSKSFNQLVIKDTYPELTDEEKEVFDKETINLERHLNVLKEYYRYESIIKDIIARFKKKEESKTKYDTKEKEIQTEEKTREKLYKDYQKASGIGFLARKNPTKMSELKVKIKEQINKLDSLYKELEELEIDIKISQNLTEGSSIYDALIASLSSYTYIEKVMIEKFKDTDVDFDLSNYVRRYIEFIYNPNADFLHKITVLLDYDIAAVISEKYALLGINIGKDEITQDTIDTAISTLGVVALTNNIKNSNMPIEEMKLICDINKIDYKLEEEIL